MVQQSALTWGNFRGHLPCYVLPTVLIRQSSLCSCDLRQESSGLRFTLHGSSIADSRIPYLFRSHEEPHYSFRAFHFISILLLVDVAEEVGVSSWSSRGSSKAPSCSQSVLLPQFAILIISVVPLKLEYHGMFFTSSKSLLLKSLSFTNLVTKCLLQYIYQ